MVLNEHVDWKFPFLSLRRQRRRLLGSTFVVVVVCHLSQKVIKVYSDLIDFNRDLKEVDR